MVDDSGIDTQASEQRGKVLIADDSRLVRATAEKYLAGQFDLVLAEDGEEAWQVLASDSSIRVVFTDLGMPKLDGYGLIRRIRQSEDEAIRHQPIIVITGASEDEGVKQEVLELGATDFITKPFKSTEIVARAEAHISYRQERETLQQNADIDPVSGALNRNGWLKQLEKEVSFANRHQDDLAVVIFGLDDYQSCYERIGEAASNQIIKHIATTLRTALRREDGLGRHGLGRFIVVLPKGKMEGVALLSKRLCAQVKALKVKVGGKTIPMTLSAGISVVHKGSPTTAQHLLHTAEHALSHAREAGHGEVRAIRLEAGQLEPVTQAVSIDEVLNHIANPQSDALPWPADLIVDRLKPLVARLDEEQKRRLFES